MFFTVLSTSIQPGKFNSVEVKLFIAKQCYEISARWIVQLHVIYYFIKGFSISYFVRIMFLECTQPLRTFIEFGLSLPIILLKRLDFVFSWNIFNLILLPLKSLYTPFRLLKNLRLIGSLSRFLFCVFNFCKSVLSLALIEIESFSFNVIIFFPKFLSQCF